MLGAMLDLPSSPLVSNVKSGAVVRGARAWGISYPGGAEACKLGLETTLISSQQVFLWIDSTNAFNTICRHWYCRSRGKLAAS